MNARQARNVSQASPSCPERFYWFLWRGDIVSVEVRTIYFNSFFLFLCLALTEPTETDPTRSKYAPNHPYLLVVDQRKAWEKRTSSVHQSHPAKGDKDPARRISFSFYTQFRKSLVDRIHSQEEFK